MIKVGILEDNKTYLEALCLFLEKEEDIDVVGTCESLETLDLLASERPDVVIADIDLGKDSGITAIQRIRLQLPDVQIIMLTVFEDEEKIFNSLKAGAIGYLLKKDPPQAIGDAIRSVHRGEGVMNGQIARKILGYFQQPVPARERLEDFQLTAREKEVLQHLMAGLSYKEIAAACFVSLDTVNSHIKKIYSKLSVRSRAEISARFR